MKLKIFLFTTLLGIVSMSAQDKNKKDSFLVKGNCSMCKSRIQKSAIKLKGVKYAHWNVNSKEFILIIDENICSLVKVKEAISMAGHDTSSLTANEEAYNGLPPCCKYRDPETIKMNHNN